MFHVHCTFRGRQLYASLDRSAVQYNLHFAYSVVGLLLSRVHQYMLFLAKSASVVVY